LRKPAYRLILALSIAGRQCTDTLPTPARCFPPFIFLV
jgi:hypothetical protein